MPRAKRSALTRFAIHVDACDRCEVGIAPGVAPCGHLAVIAYINHRLCAAGARLMEEAADFRESQGKDGAGWRNLGPVVN